MGNLLSYIIFCFCMISLQASAGKNLTPEERALLHPDTIHHIKILRFLKDNFKDQEITISVREAIQAAVVSVKSAKKRRQSIRAIKRALVDVRQALNDPATTDNQKRLLENSKSSLQALKHNISSDEKWRTSKDPLPGDPGEIPDENEEDEGGDGEIGDGSGDSEYGERDPGAPTSNIGGGPGSPNPPGTGPILSASQMLSGNSGSGSGGSLATDYDSVQADTKRLQSEALQNSLSRQEAELADLIAQRNKCKTDECRAELDERIRALRRTIELAQLEYEYASCGSQECRNRISGLMQQLNGKGKGKEEAFKGPNFKLKTFGKVELVFEAPIGKTKKNVWFGKEKKWHEEEISKVFLQDGTAYSVVDAGWPQAIFGNYRCIEKGLLFNQPIYRIRTLLKSGKCQRTYDISKKDPWASATRVTWSAHADKKRTDNAVTLINFTENKTQWNGVNKSPFGRGFGAANGFGYVKYKINGDPAPTEVKVDKKGNPIINGLGDGFYNGFITAGEIKEWEEEATELGPIIWPAAGYRRWNDGKKAWQQSSIGVRHPRGFKHGKYLYIFYISHEQVFKDGTKKQNSSFNGIYAARSRLDSGLGPGTWLCGKKFDTSCLPKEIKSWSTLDDFVNALSLKGPRVKPIIAGGGSMSFAVARVKGKKDLFVGISAMNVDGKGWASIRVSKDLVNWSDPKKIPKTEYNIQSPKPGESDVAQTWASGDFIFPRFASIEKGDPEEINPNKFFIIGDSGVTSEGKKCEWQCRISRLKLSIDVQ